MPKVTSIQPQKDKARFNIFIDGRFAFGLGAEVLLKVNLKVGQELSSEEIEKLKTKDLFGKLYDRALKFIALRPRSRQEVKRYLEIKKKKLEGDFGQETSLPENFWEQLAEKVLTNLEEKKLVDDESFAVWWCQQRTQFRPRGKRFLKAELRQKGIDEETIERAIGGQINELESAQKALSKKKNWQKLAPRIKKQKIIAFLGRLGFSWETIEKILEKS